MSVQLDFPVNALYDGLIRYAFLCLRRRDYDDQLDYLENPVNGLSYPTKLLSNVEFYLSIAVIRVSTDLYFPLLNADGFLDGIVIAKVYEDAAQSPDMTYKTLMATKDGVPLTIPGFITI